jgi:hypothetical protein
MKDTGSAHHPFLVRNLTWQSFGIVFLVLLARLGKELPLEDQKTPGVIKENQMGRK